MEDLKKELANKTFEILENITNINDTAGKYFKVLDLDEKIKKVLTRQDVTPEEIQELLKINNDFLKEFEDIKINIDDLKHNVILFNTLLEIANDKINEPKEQKYKFKINDYILNCLNIAIESKEDKEIYNNVSNAIAKTLELNKDNNFKFGGFYPKDTYLIKNYKEMLNIQEKTPEAIGLLSYLLVNNSKIYIDIKTSQKINNYEFVLNE